MSVNNTFRGKFGLVDPSTLHNVLSLQSGTKLMSKEQCLVCQRIDVKGTMSCHSILM
jgi:hypothetical protein